MWLLEEERKRKEEWNREGKEIDNIRRGGGEEKRG